MPFEPKLVTPDDGPLDDETDLGVTPEFELLTAQLSADAQMLAERYPADWSESDAGVAYLARIQQSTHGKAGRKVVWWLMGTAAAALLLGVSWGAWYFAGLGESVQGQVAGSPAQGSIGGATRVDGSAVHGTEPESQDARPAVSLERAETLLIHVSGPELEGLLDLMETQEADEPLLSI